MLSLSKREDFGPGGASGVLATVMDISPQDLDLSAPREPVRVQRRPTTDGMTPPAGGGAHEVAATADDASRASAAPMVWTRTPDERRWRQVS
jgi:hypothetical protein